MRGTLSCVIRVGGEGTQKTRTALRKRGDTPSMTAPHPLASMDTQISSAAGEGREGGGALEGLKSPESERR